MHDGVTVDCLIREVVDQITIHSIRKRYQPRFKVTWATIDSIVDRISMDRVVDYFSVDYPLSRVEYTDNNRTVFIFANQYDKSALDSATDIILSEHI